VAMAEYLPELGLALMRGSEQQKELRYILPVGPGQLAITAENGSRYRGPENLQGKGLWRRYSCVASSLIGLNS